MNQIIVFQKKYFMLAIFFFVMEICIAKFINDGFIRPYLGDFFVVILIYCFFKSFLNIQPKKLALGVLLFSYTIECLQYFKVVNLLGLQNYKLARIIKGTSFSWADMLMYTMGIIFVMAVEGKLKERNK